MEEKLFEFDYCSDLTLIPIPLRPPNLTYSPPVDRPVVTNQIKEEQILLIRQGIRAYQIQIQNQFNITECEVLERVRQLVADALNPDDKSKVKTIKDIFYPRSLLSRTVCRVFGEEDDYTVKCVWDSITLKYVFHLTLYWTKFTDIKLPQAAFGTFFPVVFGGKDREINFDVTGNRRLGGGWLIPNTHTFTIEYNWGTQLLAISFSYYKYEARGNNMKELCMTKIL